MNNQWFQSSTGDGDLALTIKGLLMALVPLSVTALQHYGFKVAQDQVIEIVQAAFAVGSAVIVLIGLVRKLANHVDASL